MSQRNSYRQWYNQAFHDLLFSFQRRGYTIERLLPLYSQLEIEALKWYDGPYDQSFLKKWKAFITILITKKVIQVTFDEKQDLQYSQILWWPTQKKHFDLHRPVYKYLKENGIKSKFVLNKNNYKQFGINETEEDSITFQDGLRFGIVLSKWRFIWRVLKASRKINDFHMTSHKVCYFNIVLQSLDYLNFFDVIEGVFQKTVNEFSPKLIVTGYELSFQSRVLSILAKRHNIATATLQVGRLHYPALKYTMVDYYYVYGAKSLYYLKKSGSLTTGILSGSDKMDTLGSESSPVEVSEIALKVRRTFEKIVLVALTGPGIAMSLTGHKANIQVLFKIAKFNPETYYIFKLNTKDNSKYYSDLKSLENVLLIDRVHDLIKYDIIYWTKECDYVITAISTSGMQAAYMLKPVIILDVLNELEGNYMVNDSIFPYTNSYDELSHISRKMHEPSFLKELKERLEVFSREYFHQEERSSSQIIGDHMLNIILSDN